MAVERRYLRDRNFVLTLIRGALDNRALAEHVAALTRESEGLGPFDELADCRELENVENLTAEGIMGAAQEEALRPPERRGKLAIVVPNQLLYGLARVYQAISEPYRSEVRVFRDLPEALAWLGMPDAEGEIERLRKESV